RSTLHKTLSASTIRLTRLRPERPLRQSRPRQNRPRLSRLPPSRNERLFSRPFLNFFKSASSCAGGAFFWRGRVAVNRHPPSGGRESEIRQAGRSVRLWK